MVFFDLSFDGGESSLSVRRFSIHEAVSTPFTVSLWVRSENPAVDIEAIVGQPAIFKVRSGYLNLTGGGMRVWSGYVSYMEQTHGEHRQTKVHSTYHLRIVPHLWLLDQRRNHRIFQHLSIPDIVDKILDEWSVRRTWQVDRGQYPKHEFRVQYGETDFAFVSRLLEEAGIAYTFPDVDDNGSVLTFSDQLHRNPPRPGPPVPYETNPTQAAEREFVSRVSLVRDVRPGALVLRDYDFRRPDYKLLGEAPKAGDEARYEQYHYLPGGMFVETGKGGDTPVADDKGVARHDQPTGEKRATRALEAARADRGGVAFESNLNDLTPGVVFRIDHHPHPDLGRPLLATDTILEGSAEGEWEVSGHAAFADVPYRPPLVTPRPEVVGVQSVRVVGPRSGNDLDVTVHVDEFGRARVQFPWDRDGKNDEDSSCWIRVVEGWGGSGYGWINLPRIGQELLVTFLEGDPDRPVLAGRVYNTENPVPYKLPEHKTVSTWKSQSLPYVEGFNEIKFEDNKTKELFYMQAEKNLRKLVKNDEVDTVGRNREQTVEAWLFETIGGNRTQHTEDARHEMTGREHHTQTKGNRFQLIRKDEIEYNFVHRRLLVKKNVDAVVKGHKRERTEWDFHTRVKGDRKDRTGKNHSLFVYQEKHEKVGQNYALETGKEIHYKAGEKITDEANDITLKGPGGFIRIDAAGIVISGTKVDINVGGSPGHGHGSHPTEVVEAKKAVPTIGAVHVPPESPAFAQVGAMWDGLKAALAQKPEELRYAALQRKNYLNEFAKGADVASQPGGVILWSGGLDYAGAIAQDLAAQRGVDPPSTTLEATPAGLDMTSMSENDPRDVKIEAWTILSRRFARSAQGEVNVVLAQIPVPMDKVVRQEIEELGMNPKVTAINVFQIQASPTGKYKDASGNTYDLVPVPMEQALANPAAAQPSFEEPSVDEKDEEEES
ncbi:MAG TPA: type VI secretion system tip protein TssI/VgrG [Polyangium sp.]|nr:type VI secretion system tip protein TssI/VgrG [Polyangium sp.]